MKKINSLIDRIEDAENELTMKILSLNTKKEREQLLERMEDEIDNIKKTYQSLLKSNKKQKNKHVKKTAKKKLIGKY